MSLPPLDKTRKLIVLALQFGIFVSVCVKTTTNVVITGNFYDIQVPYNLHKEEWNQPKLVVVLAAAQ